MRTVATSAVRRFGACAFGVSTSGPCERWIASPGSWAPGVCEFGVPDDGSGEPGDWGIGAGEFGIGVPEACAVCVGVVDGAAWAIVSGAFGVGTAGAGEPGAGVSDVVAVARAGASEGRSIATCASCIGATGVSATGAGVSGLSGDRGAGTGALDCGASGSTTTVVGIGDACAIGVGASGGAAPRVRPSDALVGCPSGGGAFDVPLVPAMSLTSSAQKLGPDATSSNTSGACRRIRRLDGATVVHGC
nr:hypothetical protein [Burkholderia metallica]